MAVTPETLRTFHDVYQSHRIYQQAYREFMDVVMNQSEDLLRPNLPHESITPQELWVIRNAFMIVVQEWRKCRVSAERNQEAMDAIADDLMLSDDTVLVSADEYRMMDRFVSSMMERFPDGVPPKEYVDDGDVQRDLNERIGEMVQDADTAAIGETSPIPRNNATTWAMLVSFAFAIGVIVGMWIRS